MRTLKSSALVRRAGLVVLMLGVCLGALLGAQQAAAPKPDSQVPPITFKVEINYVEVDARVVDAGGRFVGDLRQEEFEVLEDGKPQKVATFARVNIPVERAEAPLFVRQPIEPDVQTNVKPFEGRVYLLVLDDLHTAFTMTSRTRLAAKRFVERVLGDNDLAAVICTSGNVASSQEFTANRRLLIAAIDNFQGRALNSPTLNRIEDYQRLKFMQEKDERPSDTEAQERAFNARNALRAIEQVSEFMAGVRGRRKALVLFSQGIDFDVTDVFSKGSAAGEIRDATRAAIAAATRSNVSVYAIDPRGLASPGFEAQVGSVMTLDADPSFRLGPEGLQDELLFSQDSLRVLGEETGGFAVVNANDYATAFERIRSENSDYYVLGYYPTNDRRDGRFRKIEVKVKRPGVTVQARRGYVAPQGRRADAKPNAADSSMAQSPVLRETLNSPLAVTGVRLTATAAPFRGAGKAASVVLVLQADGRDITFQEKDGRFNGSVELSVLAVDRDGKVKNGTRQTIGLPLKPGSLGLVQSTGIRLITRLDLPAGRYQLRIGALDTGSQRAGSIHYDLEVPDFSEGPLAMSGLVLTSSLAGVTPTAGGFVDEELKQALPGPPTVGRQFQVGEELALLAEVYDNDLATPHKVDITTTVRSDDGREILRQQDERDSKEVQGLRGGYGYTTRVPLKGLAPGLYVLKVEAQARVGKRATVAREVQFRVVPQSDRQR